MDFRNRVREKYQRVVMLSNNAGITPEMLEEQIHLYAKIIERVK